MIELKELKTGLEIEEEFNRVISLAKVNKISHAEAEEILDKLFKYGEETGKFSKGNVEYYIRRNFETVPMLHFEISDSFGKRLKPDLQLKISKVKGANEDRGHISIKPVIVNLGRNIAKYVTCICVIESPDIKIWQSKWQVREDKKSCQFTITIGNVIHPTMNFETGYIELMPINTDQSIDEASLLFILYAENTEPKKFNFKICK